MSDDLLARAEEWLAWGEESRRDMGSALVRDLAAALREARAELAQFRSGDRQTYWQGLYDEARAERDDHAGYIKALTERLNATEAARDRANALLQRTILSANEAAAILGDQCEKLEQELDEARAERDRANALRDTLLGYLRQHAITHDPTVRPMWSTCNICEAQWGGEDAESHGPGCPFYIDAHLRGEGAGPRCTCFGDDDIGHTGSCPRL